MNSRDGDRLVRRLCGWGMILALLASVFAFASLAYGQEPVSRSIFDQVFEKPPTLSHVVVVVHWSTPEEIKAVCGPLANACGTVGRNNGDLVYMWVRRPRSFNDKTVCEIGHELVHNLGGTHAR